MLMIRNSTAIESITGGKMNGTIASESSALKPVALSFDKACHYGFTDLSDDIA